MVKVDSLSDSLGFIDYTNNDEFVASQEASNLLISLIEDAIDDQYNDEVLYRSFNEGYAYGEGMFDGVKSVAQDVKRAVGEGWRLVKEMFKKAIQMVKNILRDFFNQQKHVRKLLDDGRRALNERTRRGDLNSSKNIKIITYGTLIDAKLPIDQIYEGSYSEAVAFCLGMLEDILRGVSHETVSNENDLGTKTVNGKPPISNPKKKFGKLINSLFSKIREVERTQEGEEFFKELLENEIKGVENFKNTEWNALLTNMAKRMNRKAKSYLDVPPASIQEVAKYSASMGLYDTNISGYEKDAKDQAKSMNADGVKKVSVPMTSAYDITRAMITSFIGIYTFLKKHDISKRFRNKEKLWDRLLKEIDRIEKSNPGSNPTSGGNAKASSFFNQGNTGYQSVNGDSKGEFSEIFNDIFQEIKYYDGYGEEQAPSPWGKPELNMQNTTEQHETQELGSNNNDPNNNNNDPNNNNNNQNKNKENNKNNEGNNTTSSLTPYVKAFIIGSSQGTMHASIFYNSILKQWNYAFKETISAYYALTKKDEERQSDVAKENVRELNERMQKGAEQNGGENPLDQIPS